MNFLGKQQRPEEGEGRGKRKAIDVTSASSSAAPRGGGASISSDGHESANSSSSRVASRPAPFIRSLASALSTAGSSQEETEGDAGNHQNRQTAGTIGIDMEAEIVNDLNRLSIEERNKVQEVLHAVGDDMVEESPSVIEAKLCELEDELRKVRDKFAYSRALFYGPNYVKSRDFRLQFLRADRFDPKLAAARMVAYFDVKLALFGLDSLGRPLKLEDLNSEDIQLLGASRRVLKERDAAGRLVICGFTPPEGYGDLFLVLRSSFYFCTSLIQEDEMVQKKGIVWVLYNNKVAKDKPSNALELMMKFYRGMPWRVNGLHFCSTEQNPFVHLLMSFFQFAIGKEGRVRFRSHFGSHMEVQYSLMSFGIILKNFPFDADGNLRPESRPTFLEQRREIEKAQQQTTDRTGEIHLTGKDVLLGRGRPIQDFPGNVALTRLVDEHIEEYRATAKRAGQKAAICERVTRLILENGGRFVTRSKGPEEKWVEVDFQKAKEKVGHNFRNYGSRHPSSSSVPSNTSSLLSDQDDDFFDIGNNPLDLNLDDMTLDPDVILSNEPDGKKAKLA